MEYIGFIPTLFGPSGKTLEIDLIFKKPAESKEEPKKDKHDTAKK